MCVRWHIRAFRNLSRHDSGASIVEWAWRLFHGEPEEVGSVVFIFILGYTLKNHPHFFMHKIHKTHTHKPGERKSNHRM